MCEDRLEADVVVELEDGQTETIDNLVVQECERHEDSGAIPAGGVDSGMGATAGVEGSPVRPSGAVLLMGLTLAATALLMRRNPSSADQEGPPRPPKSVTVRTLA